jgi:amino acid transporter
VASTAAVSHGFASYLGEIVTLPPSWGHPAAQIAFLFVLSFVNHRGIEESTWLNILCTIVSVGALVVLVVLSLPHWGTVSVFEIAPVERADGEGSAGIAAILAGAALAFYAFVGFEDMCNVAEETRAPSRTIPRAIVIAMAAVTLIYATVGVGVVNVVPIDELVRSDVPLSLFAERLIPGASGGGLAAVALFAVTNTALFNLIMASRILYGMARQGWIPDVFGRVHARRQTPTVGVVAVFILAAGTALSGVLQVLAESTNVIILAVFFFVSLSLFVVMRRGIAPDDATEPFFPIPIAVPVAGMAVSVYLFVQFSPGAYLRAAALCAVGAVLYLVHALRERRRA